MKILTHKLRNDGPMISRAAIRNGKKLINRLKTLEMVKKELTGRSTTTRRRKSATFTRSGSITSKI